MSVLETIADKLLGKRSAVTLEFERALAKSDTDLALAIIEQKPSLAKKFEKSALGEDSLLMMAIRHGNAEVCDKLLQHGAKLNVPLKFGGENETPMSAVLRPNYTHPKVKEVLLDHFVARKSAEHTQQSLLGNLKAQSAALFASISEKLDEIIKQPGIAIAGISAPSAALGAALGAGASAALAPAVGTAAAVGVSLAVVSSIRQNSNESQLPRHRRAEEMFESLASTRDASQRAQLLPIERDPLKSRAASQLLTEDFASAAGVELMRLNAQSGRYAGPILHNTAHHVLQDLGRGSAVVHNKDHFTARDLQALQHQTKSTRINYSGGRASLDEGLGQGQSRGHSR